MPGAGLAHVYRARPGCWVVSSEFVECPRLFASFREAFGWAQEEMHKVFLDALRKLDQ